jgi:hypothetical protein
MASANRKTRRNDEAALDARFDQATQQLREQTASRVSVNDADYETHAPLKYWRERWGDPRVEQRFIEKFLKIRDAFDGNKLVPFVFNDAQLELHYDESKRKVTVKCRRIGSSRYWLARKFAKALVNPGVSVRVVPHDPQTEEEFWADLQTFYEALPNHLRAATRYYSKELIQFHDPEKGVTDSRLITLSVQPGHENKGRGQTITDLVMTEIPYWRGDQRKAALSLIEAATGGNVVAESTPGGIEWLHSIYQESKQGRGGWKGFFFAWWWNRHYRIEGAYFSPDENGGMLLNVNGKSSPVIIATKAGDAEKRDQDEYKIILKVYRHLRKRRYLKKGASCWDAEVAEYLAWRRFKIDEIGARQFKVEYPEDDRTCFELTGRPVVEGKYLNVTSRYGGATDGREYGIGVDTSLGLANGDPSAIQIVDLLTGRQVCEEEIWIQPDLLAERIADLCDQYNGAKIAVERNGPGDAVITRLIELGYEDCLYRFLDARAMRAIDSGKKHSMDAEEDAPYGFPTTTETKRLLGLHLERSLRTGRLGLSSEQLCEQLKTVVWKDDKSWGALTGYHDDLTIALAIANFCFLTEAGATRGFVGAEPVGIE